VTTIDGKPLALLRAWLPPNEAEERPQIQVATVDEQGRPNIRTVLLSEWDERGFVFHTDSASRKAEELGRHPGAAMTVLWPGFTRQLVVRGVVEVVDQEALRRAFARRSPYLKQLAWQNTTALAQRSLEERRTTWSRFTAEHDVESLAPSATWTGYLVRPDRITFWESDAAGPSHRTEYRSEAGGPWTEHHLAG
jgi:pyridoxamine 5'-phosphate oxidase